VAAIILLPVVVTFFQAVTGNWQETISALAGSGVPGLVLNTALIAVVVVPLCGIFGVASAWFVERTQLPGRRIWALLLVAPITIPLFVTSYSWATLSPWFQGFLGGVCITSSSYYPIVYLLTSASLRGMDPALEESANSLGCGTWHVFRRVILPQLRPALLGGMLIVALDTLVEYDAFVGIHYPVFANTMSSLYRVSFSSSGAALLSAASAVPCVVLLVIEARWRGNTNYTRVSQGSRRQAVRYELGRAKIPVMVAMAVLIGAGVGVPVWTLIVWFAQRGSQALAGAPAGFSDLVPASVTSILLCAAAGVVAIALALPLAVVATRYRTRLATLLERSAYMSFALPDLVGAAALGYFALHFAPFLYEDVVLLVIAYAILFVPMALVGLRVTLGQIEPRLEEAARSLGLGGLRSFGRVVLPLARPGLAAAAVLVFAFALGDLSSAQVLLPPGVTTLGTQFWADSSTVAFAAAAPFAAVMMALSFVATYVLMSRFGKVRALGEI
jgi:iron(III) transport system permease protein